MTHKNIFINSPTVIPEGTRVYAIGDIHGYPDLLRGLLDVVKKDLCDHPLQKGQDYAFVFLGDYVDRGPDSKTVLDILAELKAESRKHVFLTGNHDKNFRDVVRFLKGDPTIDEKEATLTAIGTFETYRSYGVPIDYRVDWQISEIKPLIRMMPARHQEFLETMQLSAQLGPYIFVHNPRHAFQRNKENKPEFNKIKDVADLYFSSKTRRDDLIDDRGSLLKPIIVHGHINQEKAQLPESLPHRIGLNCDTSHAGRPTVHGAVLEVGRPRRFLSFQTLERT